MDCPATLNKSGRGEDGKYFSLWQPDVRLDQQYFVEVCIQPLLHAAGT